MRISDWSSDVCSSDLARSTEGNMRGLSATSRVRIANSSAGQCHSSRQHSPYAGTKADPQATRRLCKGGQDEFVAILKESQGFASWLRQWQRAATAAPQQTTATWLRLAGPRARNKKV